jgi:EAL and modified HD-GYP domain-containing signal transduction protein
MSGTGAETQSPVSVSIARQPVFDDKRRLWGYELCCVGNAASGGSGFPEEGSVAIEVASSAYTGLQQILNRGKKILVNFDEKGVLERLPYALPPVLAAVKVSEDQGRRPAVIDALDRLKSDGYLIAISGFTGDPQCAALYDLADIIGTDAYGSPDETASRIEKARSAGALLLASRVDSAAQFDTCRGLGFSLFHGAFFKSPDQVSARRLTSVEVLRFRLLRFLEEDDPDFGSLTEAIQSDVTISFRLLAYLNSAAFGFRQRIRSIHQAVALLGWRNVRNWLRVVILTDMSHGREAEDLVLLSAQRAMFLELVAREYDFWGFDPDNLHLFGLFSLLDVLMGMPMAEVVEYLPLDYKLKAALCGEANNEYLPLLRLAQSLEDADWAKSEEMIRKLDLEVINVRSAFQASIDWANDLAPLHRSTSPSS